MKILTISLVLLSLTGCTTVSGFITAKTDKTCKGQVDVVVQSIDSASDTVITLYRNNIINQSDKNKAIMALQIPADKLMELNNSCETDPEGTKATLEGLEVN